MSAECPECGAEHPTVDSLPDHPVSIQTLQTLEDTDSIVYTGSTEIDSEGRTPMAVIATHSTVKVVSFFDGVGWLATSEDTFEEVDKQQGRLFNEMAGQCIEAGYRCWSHWMDDGTSDGPSPTGLS